MLQNRLVEVFDFKSSSKYPTKLPPFETGNWNDMQKQLGPIRGAALAFEHLDSLLLIALLLEPKYFEIFK